MQSCILKCSRPKFSPPGGVKFPAVSWGCENHSMILTPQLEILFIRITMFHTGWCCHSRCHRQSDGFPGVSRSRVCRNVQFPGCLRGDPEIVHFCHPPKKRHFWEKPEKTRKNGFLKNPSVGAQICGETRRIIYCLDTRYGPRTGGLPGPRKSGFLGGTSKTRVFAPRAKHVFLHTPETGGCEYPNWEWPMKSTVSRIDQRSE
jgi:hypothetical protein